VDVDRMKDGKKREHNLDGRNESTTQHPHESQTSACSK